MQDLKTPIKDKWEFDENVMKCFEDMLSRSIPQYEIMRSTIAQIAKDFIKEDTIVLDLGCSNGRTILDLIRSTDKRAHFVGCDVSKPAIDIARDQTKELENVSILEFDLRQGIPPLDAPICVCTSILTMQFIPIEYRQSLLNKIFTLLPDGGVFILVEKVLGSTASINDLMVKLYLTLKAEDGKYNEDEIQRKRLSLEGVLVPVTNKWNFDFLKNAGFKEVDCFWRYLNFAGYIARKVG